MRVLSAAILAIALVSISVPAAAQSVGCSGVRRMSLDWFEAKGEALIFLSATRCGAPAPCDGVNPTDFGRILTPGPIRVALTDARGNRVSRLVDAGVPANSSNCPGGWETHRTTEGRITYVWGHEGRTTLSATKISFAARTPPPLVEPIRVEVTAANGYRIAYSVDTCFTKSRSGSLSLECIGLPTRPERVRATRLPTR